MDGHIEESEALSDGKKKSSKQFQIRAEDMYSHKSAKLKSHWGTPYRDVLFPDLPLMPKQGLGKLSLFPVSVFLSME